MNFDLNQSEKTSAEGEPSIFLLVGLGNPGREYRDSRHNIGFMVIDRFCAAANIKIGKVQNKALVGVGSFGGHRVIVAKPQTFMNLSGQAVGPLLRFYRVPLGHLLVIHDDLDLPFGTIRIRPSGGAGGQKGLASTIQQLGTQDFPRLRMGIGRPPGQMEVPDYVLARFGRAEEEFLPTWLDRASEAAQSFIRQGIELTMTRFNGNGLEG